MGDAEHQCWKRGSQCADAPYRFTTWYVGPGSTRFLTLEETSILGVVSGSGEWLAFTRRANRNTRRSGFRPANPVAIIPNGIDLPELPQLFAGQPAITAAERVVLSLGRIHPKKGLGCLLRAWSIVEVEHPGWRLKIVGPPEVGHDKELRALAIALGLTRVSVEGPIYGDAKTTAYWDADVFILSTLNENFGLRSRKRSLRGRR